MFAAVYTKYTSKYTLGLAMGQYALQNSSSFRSATNTPRYVLYTGLTVSLPA
jgi:hypothetical protein